MNRRELMDGKRGRSCFVENLVPKLLFGNPLSGNSVSRARQTASKRWVTGGSEVVHSTSSSMTTAGCVRRTHNRSASAFQQDRDCDAGLATQRAIAGG